MTTREEYLLFYDSHDWIWKDVGVEEGYEIWERAVNATTRKCAEQLGDVMIRSGQDINFWQSRAEAAEALIIELGTEAYAAVQGWYPSDFTDVEGQFTFERAIEAIKIEAQMGREAHQKWQVAEAKLAWAEKMIRAGDCHCVQYYTCKRCEALRDYEENV